MELIKKKFMQMILSIVVFCIIWVVNGCGKSFSHYKCIWVSDSPYIHMRSGSNKATIEINGESKEVFTGYTNNGTEIRFYDPDIDNGKTDESIIWDTESEVKKGKLYITIVKDNVSDLEGKTIILEQQPLEENSGEE